MSDTPKTPSHGVRIVTPLTRRQIWTAIGVGATVIALGVWLVTALLPGFLTAPDRAESTGSPAARPADARKIQATLFYADANGFELVPVSREVTYGATPGEQARRIIEAQIGTPPENQISVVPAGTTVSAVFLSNRGEAFVDLGGPIVSGHPGGTLNEALTVYAIVNAITYNLPGISGVQILVDGRQVDTLAGHLDLRHPLHKATDWVRKGQ
jgi:hypothetical protein